MAIARIVGRRLLQGRAGKKALKKARPSNRLKESVRRAPVKWRIPPGRRRAIENFFVEQFGANPRGTTWSALAERYPERFRDYVSAMEEE